MTAVGDKLYYSRRGYIRRADGASSHDQWASRPIIGETKLSWLLEIWPGSSERIKVNKITMLTAADRQGMKDRYYTVQARDDKIFCDAYARDIGSAVSVCDDPTKLKAIAIIIGKTLGSKV